MKIGKRKIIIRGVDGDAIPKKNKKKKTLKVTTKGENENTVLIPFLDDVVPLNELGKYLKQRRPKRTKLENKMATNLIARLLVLGLKRKDIAEMLGFKNVESVYRLMNTVDFNESLIEAKKDIFGDLDDKLKLIYVRAITRLQDIVGSKNDFIALKACDLVLKQMALMNGKLVGNPANNNGVVGATVMDSETRQAALDYLKISQNSKRKIIINKKK